MKKVFLDKKELYLDNNKNNNKINKKFYYNFLCLGRITDKKEINKVNSPLIKYFLYNISQRNKNKKENKYPLYFNNNSNSIKNNSIKSISPNYSLIEKELNKKYHIFKCNKSKCKSIDINVLSERYSPINSNHKKESQSNSENNTSSDNSQMNSLVEDEILKKDEEIKNREKSNYLNINLSPKHCINNLNKKKDILYSIQYKPYYKQGFIEYIKNKNYFKKLSS